MSMTREYAPGVLVTEGNQDSGRVIGGVGAEDESDSRNSTFKMAVSRFSQA